MIGISMFFTALFMLLIGFPVAFTFGAVSVFFGFIAGILSVYTDGGFDAGMMVGLMEGVSEGIAMFDYMPFRIFSIQQNTILMAIPMFIFMGIVLQKTGLAEKLLESMGFLFGEIRGGIAISTVLVGSLLAASTGVVGASVVAMGVISLPVMLKYKYKPELATGTICASGTLGQIIPPSIVLIILGDVFQVPVGDLFQAAVWPGLALVGSYILYILIVSYLKKDVAPAIPANPSRGSKKKQVLKALIDIIPSLTLIILVLGSIFAGIATPTESSAVGSVGAVLLALIYKTFSFAMIKEAALESVKITSMVFAILIGATAFSMVFSYTGGEEIVAEFMSNLPGDDKLGFIIFTMVVILVLGFFIDFVEISYIIVPILVPISEALGINPVWFAILIAMNLQTSFLTPPFGFSLFYLKGVAPASVSTMQIYRGVIPFIFIQIVILILLAFFPEVFGISSFLE
ncbi:MAG: TRAP transporter large permease subunit [Epsilonproteobacteria bacterium]|nr:TRAP transporter large permease subunit [Campylobacterota bacterium]OIO14444.1 MAG: C4-dicarboxylate ABC transporter [Helicobacteraceae bacterium CG1_02_36_14]PIP10734.1 MAG: C4-dicarboxylate ABC transporter [Sulfurimonas sp. CG23_combo_of_CG06-09_8_20_14_all_36_33]PIS25068.1 MAG: C4-dicarboxylate ABC transporter [Sulfurimonas sp. CG08_land_8_20_14_0_20_36_33]PIU35198.1 MAG: C4-dicarboxylate ABC transporter [Sulfurimonas sp. CG07_land_8_20_14_0_80_36_56]PIV03221.1 MAG: C4-dicarboxylate ABC 